MTNRSSTPAYSWYVLALLLAAYTCSWMDRYVLVILIEPMKADLHLSDTVVGLIGGFAFALIYSVAGIPIARWADRGNRRSLIALGIAVWSAMTFCGGLARNAGQLVLARIGVALGESACSPTAHSLISDYFPIGRRATALSIYQLGITTGIALGLAVGGWANALYGWRSAFMIVGLPGFLLAFLFRLTVREPIRGQSETGANTAALSLRDTLHVMVSRKSFLIYALALGFCSFADTAFEMWSPAYLMRVYHLSSSVVGSRTGLLEAIAGLGGTLSGGLIADKLGARDPRWYLWMPVLSVMALIPSVFLFLTAGVSTVFVFYFVAMFLAGSYMGPVVGLTQRLMPVRMRALAASIQFLILNLLGPGAGVSFVGITSDALARNYGVLSLRYALMTSLGAAGIGIALFLYAAHLLPGDIELVQKVVAQPAHA